MTVLETLTFDSDTSGSQPSWPANWSTNGATPVAHTGAAKHGANGCRWASTASSGRVQRDLGSNQTAHVWSGYFNMRTASSANFYVAGLYSLTTGGSIQGDFRVNPNGTVTLRNGTTGVATSSATIAADTWYRFEWSISTASSSQELRIFVGESNTPHLTLTGSFSGVIRVLTFGPHMAAAGGSLDVDTMKRADAWVGPEDGAPDPPTESSRQQNACVVTFDQVLDDITQTSGSASAPTLITGSTYMFVRGSDTRVYEATVDGSDPLVVSIPAAATSFTSQWPKRPTGTLPGSTWE